MRAPRTPRSIVPQDLHPHIYRTVDAGATWQTIVQGLPDTAFARVVREDPARKGLYRGTERGVYVSFDAGSRWEPLQLNLPASSMRDMVVHGDDLVLATYGRALWILDNLTPLRQLGGAPAAPDVRLLTPAPAVRARWDVNGDTPLPIETPTAPNPPEGAIIDYYLPAGAKGEVTLTISDARGQVVRTFASAAQPAPALLANVPGYWFTPATLTTGAGLNRFAWNLRRSNPKILPFGYFWPSPPVRPVHAGRTRNPGSHAARAARRPTRSPGRVPRSNRGGRTARSSGPGRAARSTRQGLGGRSRRTVRHGHAAERCPGDDLRWVYGASRPARHRCRARRGAGEDSARKANDTGCRGTRRDDWTRSRAEQPPYRVSER